MDGDISAIGQWAEIFLDPVTLAETLSKHYLLHRAEIKTDISNMENDWDN